MKKDEGVAAPLEPSPDVETFFAEYHGYVSHPWISAGKLNFAKAYAAAVSKNLQEELARIKKLFHDLTPGGSEFYNDPDYCADYLRKRSQSQHEIAVKSIKRAKELEKEIAALWIPIEKKLPESRMVVLVKKAHMSPTIQSAFYCPTHSKGPGFYCGERLTDVTHWRPFTESC